MNLHGVRTVHLIFGLLLLLAGAFIILYWDSVKVPMINTCQLILNENLCGSTLRKLVATFLWAIAILPIIVFLELFLRAKPEQPQRLVC